MDKTFDKYLTVCICTGLVLVTFAVFRQVHRYEFVNYDDGYINETRQVREGLTFEGIRWAFTSSYGDNWFAFTRLSYMPDFQPFGVNPGWPR